jgi:hypothetical protein
MSDGKKRYGLRHLMLSCCFGAVVSGMAVSYTQSFSDPTPLVGTNVIEPETPPLADTKEQEFLREALRRQAMRQTIPGEDCVISAPPSLKGIPVRITQAVQGEGFATIKSAEPMARNGMEFFCKDSRTTWALVIEPSDERILLRERVSDPADPIEVEPGILMFVRLKRIP